MDATDPQHLEQLQAYLGFFKDVIALGLATATFFIGQWYERRKIQQQHDLQAHLDIDNARRNRETDILFALHEEVTQFSESLSDLIVTGRLLKASVAGPDDGSTRDDNEIRFNRRAHFANQEKFVLAGKGTIRTSSSADILGIGTIRTHLGAMHAAGLACTPNAPEDLLLVDFDGLQSKANLAHYACMSIIVEAYNKLWNKPIEVKE